MRVNKQAVFDMKMRVYIYEDEVQYDIVPMQACHVLLRCRWKFDENVQHDGCTNKYAFHFRRIKIILKPLSLKDLHDAW